MENKLNNIIENLKKKGQTNREYMTLHDEGSYIIRILQDINDSEAAPFEIFHLHSGYIHPFFKKSCNIRCLRTDNCPMCIDAAKKKLIDKNNAWKYTQKPYYIYNIIDRKSGKLKILKLTWSAHQKIFLKIIEAAQDGINLMNFKSGRDIEIVLRRINNKINYKVHILPENETKPVPNKIIEELKLLKPLSETYRIYSREEMIDIINGKITENKKNYSERPRTSKSSLIENLNKKNEITGNNNEEIKDSLIKEKIDKLNIFENDED